MPTWCFAIVCAVVLAGLTGCDSRHPTSDPPPLQTEHLPPGAYADINGLHMYYETHGEGGVPMLLLHGGGSTIQTTFGATLPLLSRHRLVIAPEQQGHGHTADIDRPLSFEQMADDTAALLEQLRLGPVDVFGFSNGGSVALQLTMRHPQLVRKVIAGSIFYRADGLTPQTRQLLQNASADTMPALYRDAYRQVAPHPEQLPKVVSKLMTMMLTFTDWREEDLHAIKAPVLLLNADDDIAPVEHVVALSHLIPHAQLAVFPGGHGTYLGEALATKPGSQVPALTVALIEEFLNEPLPDK